MLLNPDDHVIQVLRADLDLLADSMKQSLEMLMTSTSKALHSMHDRLATLEKEIDLLKSQTNILDKQVTDLKTNDALSVLDRRSRGHEL